MKNTSLYKILTEKNCKIYEATEVLRAVAVFANSGDFIDFLETLERKVVFAVPMFLDETNLVNDEMFSIEGIPTSSIKKVFSLEAKKHNEIVESFFTKPYKVHYFVISGFVYSYEDNLLPKDFEIKCENFVDKIMEEWEGTKEYEEMITKLQELGDQQEAQHQVRLKEIQEYLLKHEDIPFLTNQQARSSWMDKNRRSIFQKLFPDIEEDFFGTYGVNKDGCAFITTVYEKYKFMKKEKAELRKQEEKREREEKEKQRKIEKELKEQEKRKKSDKNNN